ncbi:MAG: hypothetical protein ACLU80_10350 [Dorea sp.]
MRYQANESSRLMLTATYGSDVYSQYCGECVYATGVTATENAQTIDAQSTDAQALTPEEQKAQGIAKRSTICRWNRMDIKDWATASWDWRRSRNRYGSRNGSNSGMPRI